MFNNRINMQNRASRRIGSHGSLCSIKRYTRIRRALKQNMRCSVSFSLRRRLFLSFSLLLISILLHHCVCCGSRLQCLKQGIHHPTLAVVRCAVLCVCVCALFVAFVWHGCHWARLTFWKSVARAQRPCRADFSFLFHSLHVGLKESYSNKQRGLKATMISPIINYISCLLRFSFFLNSMASMRLASSLCAHLSTASTAFPKMT